MNVTTITNVRCRFFLYHHTILETNHQYIVLGLWKHTLHDVFSFVLTTISKQGSCALSENAIWIIWGSFVVSNATCDQVLIYFNQTWRSGMYIHTWQVNCYLNMRRCLWANIVQDELKSVVPISGIGHFEIRRGVDNILTSGRRTLRR